VLPLAQARRAPVAEERCAVEAPDYVRVWED
jgi:hypothetical protein